MKKSTVPIKYEHVDFLTPTDGWDPGVPGLLIWSGWNCDCDEWIGFGTCDCAHPSWGVIHENSGYLCGLMFRSPEPAVAAAVEMGSLCDWTQSPEDLEAQKGVLEASLTIQQRFGGAKERW